MARGWYKTKMMLFTLVMAAFSAMANDEITGKVVSVIDGNTLEVSNNNQVYKIALLGIDCPELGQEYGDKAKRFLEKKILDKNVTVKFQGKDRWGNYLAVVMVDDGDLRIDILQEGLAWTTERNPLPELEQYRKQAMQKSRGLWKAESPTPPWVYRREQTMMQAKSH